MATERVTVLDLMGQASESVPRVGAAAEPQAPPPEEDLEARIDRLSEALESVPEPGRSVAEELLSAVLQMHGEALGRIRDLIDDDTAQRLLADPTVAGVLLVHDMYPVSLEERVVQALDSVRPYMESHGGDVELLGVDDGVARLKLEGSCHGCAASASTLELAIKKALDETAPDLLDVVVEGEDEPPDHGPPIPGHGAARWPGKVGGLGRGRRPGRADRGIGDHGVRRRRRGAGGQRERHAAGLPQPCAACEGSLAGAACPPASWTARRARPASTCPRRAGARRGPAGAHAAAARGRRPRQDRAGRMSGVARLRRLATSLRATRRHGGGARGRALRPVRAGDRRGPPPPAAPGPAPDRVRVRGVHRHARGRRRVPAGGHARGVAARPGAGRRALGLVRHPDRAGVLHAQHDLGGRGGHVPQPRGPDRVRAGPVGLGPAGGRQPGADHARGRRRGPDRGPQGHARTGT